VSLLTDDAVTALLDAIPDAMVCAGLDGRIVLVNSRAAQLFGYDGAELAGQPVETLVPEAAREAHRGHRAGYARAPQGRPMATGTQFAGRRRDGTTFPAEVSLSVLDTVRGPLILAAVRDITGRLAGLAGPQQVRMQAEADQPEQRNCRSGRLESLGQLAGGVARDVSNLLSVITSYASFVGQEIAGEQPAARWRAIREDVEEIRHAARRATALTEQLLAFARRPPAQPRTLNLGEVVAGIRLLLACTLGAGIKLAVGEMDGLAAVRADPGQIEQVLVELAVNARDAMPSGGTLAIETANTVVGEPDAKTRGGPSSGRYVRLSVSDTGAGMSREISGRAFEPFFTTKPDGAGLGLAAVYGIIAQAGGTARIYSEPGIGTTVTLLLPVSEDVPAGPARPAGRPAPDAAADAARETVLLVEDEAALLKVISRILTSHGYRVVAAANGPEALRALAAQPAGIDVLLTDVVMPHMHGKELAAKVRAVQPGVPVLFMSGYTHGLLSAKGILEPGVQLIAKPFSEEALLARLREILPVKP